MKWRIPNLDIDYCIQAYIIKAISKAQFFYYEKSYGLAVQTAVTIATILLFDFAQAGTGFVDILFTLAMFSVGYLLVQFVFYGLYERLDNNYSVKPARNVPLMLYISSVLCMCCYALMMI